MQILPWMQFYQFGFRARADKVRDGLETSHSHHIVDENEDDDNSIDEKISNKRHFKKPQFSR